MILFSKKIPILKNLFFALKINSNSVLLRALLASCLTFQTAVADTFRILNNDRESLQCRIDLIEQANKEILLSYFIVNDDLVGKALFQLLVEAAQQRRVKVCLLIDAVRSRIARPTIAFLEENGVEVQVFNPARLFKPRSITHRLHDKIFMTDARNCITGGRNIKRDYYELGEQFNFTDRDVLIEGNNAIYIARNHFYSIWNNRKLSFRRKVKPISDTQRKHIAAELVQALNTLQQTGVIHLKTNTQWNDVPPTTAPVQFAHDDFYKKKGNKIIETDKKDLGSTNAFLNLINNARQSVIIENAYIVPTPKMKRTLRRAVKRGIYIRMLTNSEATNDVMLSHAAYLIGRKELLKMGIEIWEYQGPKMLHTKAAVIDDTISVIGSYNLHAVSQKWTTEVFAWVADPQISRQHRAIMDNNLLSAVQIGCNNRPTPATASRLKKPDFNRRLRTFLARYTVAYLLKII
ncbi:phosphatidylserine/phosphatidylglycerophosphate/cardiolipin synthase family protein [Sphingobacteriales bacterium UPWRP_1]|nr:hypothetical protein B6N25_12340 [Sphingobacteriales bacterium TSM_CSS]PSJ74122.1 phosphatidylserine/phosphatidylglycerophosphate/cardiolipin synthase family protein [Sphingobacteriales bacterium UPWRP_1]